MGSTMSHMNHMNVNKMNGLTINAVRHGGHGPPTKIGFPHAWGSMKWFPCRGLWHLHCLFNFKCWDSSSGTNGTLFLIQRIDIMIRIPLLETINIVLLLINEHKLLLLFC